MDAMHTYMYICECVYVWKSRFKYGIVYARAEEPNRRRERDIARTEQTSHGERTIHVYVYERMHVLQA